VLQQPRRRLGHRHQQVERRLRDRLETGGERLVELVVEEGVEIAGVLPPGVRVLDYSPFNPPVERPMPG
jgi:hypothetical protein